MLPFNNIMYLVVIQLNHNILTLVISFFQFILRSEVLKLYRDILRTIYKIPDPKDRKDMLQWVRQDFQKNKTETDQVIRIFCLSSIRH